MLSDDQVRRLALALPEAEEGLHRGQPSFQVGSHVFASLMSDERQAVVRLPMADQAALVGRDPKTFSMGPWRHEGWTFVNLIKVSEDVLAGLLEKSWREFAPKRAIDALDDR
jgi:hypothetical protein